MTAIVDTSFLFALANQRDRYHSDCLALSRTIRETLIVPSIVIPEAAYLIGTRVGHHIMREFVRQMSGPGWLLEQISNDDLSRTHAILEQYHDLQPDFVDAAIVAIAERLNVRRLLTLDSRDFRVIRPSHTASFEILPDLQQ